ncbi:carbohydrate ABC transporter permease [Brevibacillus sp. HB2.2]|uniref:carbohydrate ABC transporter permease n=1 Tax=Brevibacillus sp. HB2.2 TaxID=2738846 RepID=UPI00156B2BED|nr:carbohydrate ABC transporter permease [Brevibacillus sp. HB2.2]NRS46466.1 carbohydrate ABC transporter permease [Brevibacillus sp. HB2.2]
MIQPNRVYKWMIHSVLFFFSFLFLAPFIWMFLTAVKSPQEAFVYPPVWFPSEFHFSNFLEAWNKLPFTTFLLNSVIVTGLGVIGQLLASSLVAYGFARFDFKGRDMLFMILLASMMIPWDVTAIPQYIEFNALGWIDTLLPLIVPTWFGSPFFIFLFRQYLLTIPKELEDAARIDGANSLQIYLKIILPLMSPVLVVGGVYQMINSWNDYLGPLIFLNDQSKYTLTLGLMQFKGMFDVDVISVMATTLLICVPPIFVFFLAQRYIMDGASTTGFK